MQELRENYLRQFRNFLKVKTPSERTQNTYCSRLASFLSSFKPPVKQATAAQLTEYISSMSSRASMAQTHTVLNYFYTYILKQPNKVSKYIPYPEPTLHIPHVPTHDQVIEMIDSTANTKHKLIIRLLYVAGLRVGELCNLKWSDIKREQGANPLSIHVTGKGMKDRLIPLSSETYELLIDYCAEYALRCDSKDHYIFGDENKYSVHSVQNIVKRAGEAIGMDLSPHDLRHAFGLNNRRKGMDLGKLQELMGHSNFRTTRIYAGIDNLHMEPLA